MTFVAFACFLLILFSAGLPLSMLLPEQPDGRRVLLTPVLGLCAVILLTFFGASWGLTGRNIAKIALVVVGASTAISLLIPRGVRSFAARWRFRPLSRQEFRAAGPALCIGLLAVVIVAWPLFIAGCTRYWGFANPDQAYYMTIVDYLDGHQFGSPPAARFHAAEGGAGANGTESATILGLAYLFPMVSTLTGVPSNLLFGVLCSAMIFLGPLSIFALCRASLSLSVGGAAAAACMVAVSSVGAQMFYLHSLGALTVAVVCPAAVVLAAWYVAKPEFRTALLLAFIAAGMFFCYFPGIGVLGIVVGGWFLLPLFQRKLRLRSLAMMAGLAIVMVAIAFPKQSVRLLQRLVIETGSNRLANVHDETILIFDSILTEEFPSSFWGLKTVGVEPLHLLSSPDDTVLLLGGIGAFLIGITAFGMWKRRRIAAEFQVVLVMIAVVISLYFGKANGYGVYKLITWLGPLAISALAVSSLWMFATSSRISRSVAVLAVFSFLAGNLAETVRLGRASRGGAVGIVHNAPRLTLTEFHDLQGTSRVTSPEPVFAGIPDQVMQRWATPFLVDPKVYYMPALTLNTLDSDEPLPREYRRRALAALRNGYFLYTTKAVGDIVAAPSQKGSIWHNRIFAIAPITEIQDQLLLGAGWYRREFMPFVPGHPEPSRWLRKRAEILLLSPKAVPQRLLLRVRAGYGIESPVRHLRFYIDGDVFDRIEFSGEARILTKAFTAAGRAGVLEIEVEENVQPLPRTHGIWNRWVPRDPRRLNVAVFEVQLAAADADQDPVGRGVDLTSASQMDRGLYDGIYPDRWLTSRASFELRMGRETNFLRLRGLAPGETNLQFPIHLGLEIDNEHLPDGVVKKAGNFDLWVPVPASTKGGSEHNARVTIQPEGNCFVPADDTRCMTVRLAQVSFQASAPKESGTESQVR